MKLFLSSYRIPDPEAFSKFVGKEPSQIKVALILNSKDYKPADERRQKNLELQEYFGGFGFQVKELNLLNFDNPDDLLNEFLKYDVLWFNGGNVFCLRWAISKAGGEEVLRKVLDRGVIYAGDSAGAMVTGPSLRHYEIAEDPTLAPEAIYDGLNLVDFVLLPHWGSSKFKEFGLKAREIENKLIDNGVKMKKLTDEEYLLVEDGKIII